MRYMWISVLVLFLFLAVPAWPQQAISSQTSQSPPAASQDPQAVAVLNQALAVAGGAAAIQAIADYTATGNITYHWDQDEQGTVTVLGLGLGDFRIDANLSGSTYSRSVHDNQTSIKALDGSVRQSPQSGPVPASDAFPNQTPMFPDGLLLPYAPLLAVINNPRIMISNKGLAQLDGESVYDIRVQQVLRGRAMPDPMAQYHTIDFFVDATTFRIVMTQDTVPKNTVHQIRYSNYTLTNGIEVPFAVSETIGGQKTWEIQLSGAVFNKGLQDLDFILQ